MYLLDGKQIANQIKNEIAQKVSYYTSKGLRPPSLAVIMVGDDPASASYVRNKIRSCEQVGFKSVDIKLIEETTEQELIDQVHKLNEDEDIDGFIVQLPLPSHIDEHVVIENILPEKDVDGFHPTNLGRLLIGLPSFIPATPLGIMELLRRYHISVQGKHVVIVGRSNIVGKPLAALLIQRGEYGNATVTVCHSHTKNIEQITAQADILVAAVGKPGFITADMVKPGATVIDVGINSIPDSSAKKGYRLVGDVDFDKVKDKVEFITPVPGGVGQMTVVALLMNTLKAYEQKFRF